MGEPLREELPEKEAQPDALVERLALCVVLPEPDCGGLPELHAETDGDALPAGDALGLSELKLLRLDVTLALLHGEPLREREGLPLLLAQALKEAERVTSAEALAHLLGAPLDDDERDGNGDPDCEAEWEGEPEVEALRQSVGV